MTKSPEEKRLEAVEDQLAALTKLNAKLLEALTEKTETKRVVRSTPAQARANLRANARRGRQTKAARRCGMTREQFIAKYGDIDYVPEGANAKVIPYGPRKKREDEPPERARSKGKRR
jgi:hypothetical protein